MRTVREHMENWQTAREEKVAVTLHRKGMPRFIRESKFVNYTEKLQISKLIVITYYLTHFIEWEVRAQERMLDLRKN